MYYLLVFTIIDHNIFPLFEIIIIRSLHLTFVKETPCHAVISPFMCTTPLSDDDQMCRINIKNLLRSYQLFFNENKN